MKVQRSVAELKPRVLECIDRLKVIVEHASSPQLVGMYAWNLYSTILAAYGPKAGDAQMRACSRNARNERGLCGRLTCSNKAIRPSPVCEACERKFFKRLGGMERQSKATQRKLKV